MKDEDKFCANCGSTLVEMGEKSPKMQQEQKTQFEKRAEYFGGVQVKERKANVFANMDMKLLSIIMALAMFAIFLLVRAYFETRTNTIGVDDFAVTLPSSMREVDDVSFQVLPAISHQEFANSRMEFTFTKYDAVTIIPDLASGALTNDYREMEKSVTAKSKLGMLERTFITDLDESFSESFDDYKCLSQQNNRLSFTYHDKASVDNYVEVMLIVKDQELYQFTCMCSETDMKKYDKKFDTIFSSIDF